MFTWENKSLKRESIKGVLMMSKKKKKEKKKENEWGKKKAKREKKGKNVIIKRMKNTVMKYKRRFFCTRCIE